MHTTPLISCRPGMAALQSLRCLAGLAALAILSESASAHFTWLSIRGHGGSELHAHFSEGRFDNTVDGLGEALYRSAYRTEAGVLSLEAVEHLGENAGFRTTLPAMEEGAHPTLVAGTLVYGIFGRGGPPSLLSYDSKGARTLADSARDMGLELEVFARREGDELVLFVEFRDEPLAGSEVVVVEGARGSESRFESDAKGEVRLPFPVSSAFSVRARAQEPAIGEYDGKAYERKLRYSTLCIEHMADVSIPEGTEYEAWVRLNETDVRRARSSADVFGMKGGATVRVADESVPVEFVYLGGQLEVLKAEGLSDASAALVKGAIADSLHAVRHGSRYHPPTATASIEHDHGDQGLVVLVEEKGRRSRLTIVEHAVKEVRTELPEGSHIVRIASYGESASGARLPHVEVHIGRGGDGAVESLHELERTFSEVSGMPVPESIRITALLPDGGDPVSVSFKDVELIQ